LGHEWATKTCLFRQRPTANVFAERSVRTLRADCDRIFVLGRCQLEHVVRVYRTITTATDHTERLQLTPPDGRRARCTASSTPRSLRRRDLLGRLIRDYAAV
jgi:hypothetical protein